MRQTRGHSRHAMVKINCIYHRMMTLPGANENLIRKMEIQTETYILMDEIKLITKNTKSKKK